MNEYTKPGNYTTTESEVGKVNGLQNVVRYSPQSTLIK